MAGFSLKPIIPPKRDLAAAAKDAVDRAIKEQAALAVALFDQTTDGWKHPVTFTQTPTAEGIDITTTDEIYGYVDQGTRPHVIAPHGKALRINVGGSPKTHPGVLSSGGGSPGSPVFVRKPVQHPGTAARNFSVEVKKACDEGLPKRIDDALKDALG